MNIPCRTIAFRKGFRRRVRSLPTFAIALTIAATVTTVSVGPFDVRAGLVQAAEPPIVAVAFAPGGASVVVGSQSGVVELSWPALERIRRIEVEPEPGQRKLVQIHDLVFAPDGKTLAVVGGRPAEEGAVLFLNWRQDKSDRGDGEPVRVDRGTGREESFDAAHELLRLSTDDVVYRAAWNDNGRWLAASGGDEKVYLLEFDRRAVPSPVSGDSRTSGASELATEKSSDDDSVVRALSGHSRDVLAVTFLPGGELISGSADASLRLWSVDDGRLTRTLNNHTDAVHAIALRPKIEGLPMIASAGADRTVRFWQPTIGRLVRFARLPAEPLDIAWTPDGERVVASGSDGRIHQIDATTAEITTSSRIVRGQAFAIAVSPDGSAACVGGTGGEVVASPLE